MRAVCPSQLASTASPQTNCSRSELRRRSTATHILKSECLTNLFQEHEDGERMKMSGQVVKARWRYEQIDDASHWIPLDAPDRLNQFLIEWLG
jgi:pimeloyl-ACP methyl ester carboxylesterase